MCFIRTCLVIECQTDILGQLIVNQHQASKHISVARESARNHPKAKLCQGLTHLTDDTFIFFFFKKLEDKRVFQYSLTNLYCHQGRMLSRIHAKFQSDTELSEDWVKLFTSHSIGEISNDVTSIVHLLIEQVSFFHESFQCIFNKHLSVCE